MSEPRVFHPGDVIPSNTWVYADDLPLTQTGFEERVRKGQAPRYEELEPHRPVDDPAAPRSS